MNNAWIGLEKAPQGTLKNKIHLWASFTPHSFFWPYCFLSLLSVLYLYIHRLGLRLLSRVKPSEIFLKSISKEITDVQITYPSRFHLFPRFLFLWKLNVFHFIILYAIIYGFLQSYPLNQSFALLVNCYIQIKNEKLNLFLLYCVFYGFNSSTFHYWLISNLKESWQRGIHYAIMILQITC